MKKRTANVQKLSPRPQSPQGEEKKKIKRGRSIKGTMGDVPGRCVPWGIRAKKKPHRRGHQRNEGEGKGGATVHEPNSRKARGFPGTKRTKTLGWTKNPLPVFATKPS